MRLRKSHRWNIHVVAQGRTAWIVELEGGDQLGSFGHKSDAMEAARCVARAVTTAEVFEHNGKGQIVDRSTYPRSSDPVKSKG